MLAEDQNWQMGLDLRDRPRIQEDVGNLGY